MFKKLLLIFNGLFLAVIGFGQYSQSPVVVATGGGFTFSEGYSLSYTYGELSVRTLTKTSNILTQGFQQGKYHPGGNGSINDFKYGPNPVDEKLKLQFYFSDTQSFIIQIYNMLGQASGYIVQKDVGNGNQVDINFSNLGKGLYLVKVQSADGKFQRIIKIEKI